MLKRVDMEKTVTASDLIDSQNWKKEARRLFKNGEFYAANNAIDEAIDKNPRDASNWSYKALILFASAENRNLSCLFDAYNCFDRALKIKPDDPVIKYGKSKFLLGWCQIMYDTSNDYSFAFDRINEYLAMDVDKTKEELSTALNLRGCIFYDAQNFNEAIKDFDNALALEPYDEDIQQNKRNCLYDWAMALCDIKKYDSAMVLTDKFLSMIRDKESEEYVLGLNLKATIYYNVGYYNEAALSINQAWVLDPYNEEIRNNRQIIMKKLNLL